MTTQTPESVPFRAEVKQLLHILAHALYSDREIFLRELISNASDALNRLKFEMLTTTDVLDPEAELEIQITVDEQAKTITLSDTGVGMTRDELVENLGTIAQSGARAVMERLAADQRGGIIGQFGVGFYSAFVVADEVAVVSRSFRPEAEAYEWRSDGGENYTLTPATRETRGTSITLHLKEDAHDFASAWRLRQIVRKHSDYVAFPVLIDGDRANQTTALWRQRAKDVEPQQYTDFYRQLTFDYDEPLMHLHLVTDAPVDLHTILFIPGKRERGMIERRVEGKIKLYSRKILIQEEAKDLLPAHFRFVEGVVDSEDIPLNVSRELVQNTPVMTRIKKSLTTRLTKELVTLANTDSEKYGKFWSEFGVFIKEGIGSDAATREDLLPLLRFHGSASGDEQVSLEQYVAGMVEGQDEIYYVLASDLASARRSPHLDGLAERGISALLLAEVIDGFMLGGLREYQGKKLRNLDDPSIALPGESAATEVLVSDDAFVGMVNRFKEVLGERAAGVRAAQALRSSPLRLVPAESAQGHEMDRVRRLVERDYSAPARIVELNRSSPLVADLAALIARGDQPELTDALVAQLYDSALLLEGLHPNPAEMVDRIALLMAAAAAKPAN